MAESKRSSDCCELDDVALKRARALVRNDSLTDGVRKDVANGDGTLVPPMSSSSTARVLDTIRSRTDIHSSLVDLDYQRISISDVREVVDEDTIVTCRALQEAMSIRENWIRHLTSDLAQPPTMSRRPSVMLEISDEIDALDLLPSVKYGVLERAHLAPTTRYETEMVNGLTRIMLTSDSKHADISKVPSFDDFLSAFTKVCICLSVCTCPT